MKELGDNFFREKKYYEAIFKYCMELIKGNDDIKIYSNRSLAYIKLHNYVSAKDDIEICINRDTNNHIYWGRLGYVLSKIGNYEKSLLSYYKAYELNNLLVYQESIDIVKRKMILNDLPTEYIKYLDNLSTNALETLLIKDLHNYIDNPLELFKNEEIREIIKGLIV